MPQVVNKAQIAAPPERVWRVLGEEFGAIDRWARMVPNCRLEVDGPVGIGATRVIAVGPLFTLRETVVVFEPGVHLAYEVWGLPSLVRSVRSDWTLHPSEGGTEVSFVCSLEPGWGALGAGVMRLSTGQIASGLRGLLRALKREAERREREEPGHG
jgi:uncharacterized protein YndB with AHSA1/START domain